MQVAIEVLMVVLFVLFFSLEIIKLIKIDRIEKKYVRSVKAIRRTEEIQQTINYFQKQGWITLNVLQSQADPNIYEITFIK